MRFASASSVSLFPRERMRDITSDRFALVKTSDISVGQASRLTLTFLVSFQMETGATPVLRNLTIISGQRQPPFHFIWQVRKHPGNSKLHIPATLVQLIADALDGGFR
jgi:hypothetical protein